MTKDEVFGINRYRSHHVYTWSVAVHSKNLIFGNFFGYFTTQYYFSTFSCDINYFYDYLAEWHTAWKAPAFYRLAIEPCWILLKDHLPRLYPSASTTTIIN